ncbi:EAL domain-containing protein [Shewanella corallii]|uniref:EAL domain-containing protein n=1 Tax=Shewanella corallii TaxID=560080 RepID=A0ABT0N5W6_9GAMM|nr:EAL domain-containing protein [Shewanella corallii]
MISAFAPKLHSLDRHALLIGVMLFVLPILAALSTHKMLTAHLVDYRMQQTMDSITGLINQQTHNGESKDAHNQLVNAFNFDCGAKDQALLSSPGISPSEVRVVQLELAGAQRCSNLGTPVDFHLDSVKKVDGVPIYLGTSRSPLLESRALVYILQLGPHRLLAMVNNRVYSDMLNNNCKNCYQLVFNYPELKPILLGPTVLRQDRYKYTRARDADAFGLELTLNAGDQLHKEVSEQVWLVLLLSSLGIGFAANWLVAHWRNRRISPGYLIRRGLENGEFIPYYQPVIDTQTGELIGQEVLIRWQRPDGQLIPPSQFIPYAEEHGLIIPMTHLLLEKICQDLPSLQGWVSINVVAEHLEKGLLSQYLKSKETDISRICFELTERQPMTNFSAAVKEIETLGKICHGVKLDDFGTGFGGFGYLHKLGIKCIKIDKMFIDTIGTDDLKRGVLNSIIAFGRETSMEMIAEGVETQQQLDYLSAKGVHLVQGYFYAQPLSLADLLLRYPILKPHD